MTRRVTKWNTPRDVWTAPLATMVFDAERTPSRVTEPFHRHHQARRRWFVMGNCHALIHLPYIFSLAFQGAARPDLSGDVSYSLFRFIGDIIWCPIASSGWIFGLTGRTFVDAIFIYTCRADAGDTSFIRLFSVFHYVISFIAHA